MCLFLQQLVVTLVLIVNFYSLFITESILIGIRTDTFKESQWFRVYRFGIIIRIAVGNITPEIFYFAAILIRIEYLLFQHQMTIIQQPVAQVLVIDIQLTIILTNRFLYKAEIILEVIILHLPENTFTYGISDMFQYSFFGINNAFDTECIDCFRTGTFLIRPFRLFAVLHTKVIDILQAERTQKVISRTMLLFQKQTEINGIRQQLWQFCKRIDYHAIFIHIRVKHQTELLIRSKVQLYLLFPTNNVRRNKTSDIQRTQLFQCSITILMVASGLTSGRNIQFRHHGINHNVSMLISLLCTGLSNNINNST